MNPNHPPWRRHALAAMLATAPLLATAQVTLRPDGVWRHLFTAGANASSGNTDAASLNLSSESARVTSYDKWTVQGQVAYARNAGVTTAERFSLGTQYNRDFSPQWFGFGSGDVLRDELANIHSRQSVAAGIGHHVIQREGSTFDVSGGLGYSRDRFVTPAFVGDALRDAYGRTELVLAEESNHTLTPSTSLRQRLAVYPVLGSPQDYRATFDSNLTVAMTKTINLSAGLSYRFNNDPGIGLKKGDLSFVTGVSFRFD